MGPYKVCDVEEPYCLGYQPYAPATLYPLIYLLVLISLTDWVNPWGIVWPQELGSLKKFNGLICTWTHNPPACSIASTIYATECPLFCTCSPPLKGNLLKFIIRWRQEVPQEVENHLQSYKTVYSKNAPLMFSWK